MLASPERRRRRGFSKSMNSRPDFARLQHVAHRQEHAVAVEVRKSDRARVEHAHESGIAALVGTARQSLDVGRREKEHVAAFDERAIRVADVVDDQALLDAVGQPARVEAILQLAAATVIEVAHQKLRIGR